MSMLSWRVRAANSDSILVLLGADEMTAYLEQQLGVRDGQTTKDGAITWHSTIECLGACGGAPMMQVDHRFEENLTPERIDAIVERLRTEPAGQGWGREKGGGGAAESGGPRRRNRAVETEDAGAEASEDPELMALKPVLTK